MNKDNIFNPDTLFEQITAISKAGAYDAIAPEYAKVKEENIQLKARVKYLEELINEYTLKMKANLSGGKVDSFLKDQVKDYNWSEVEQEIEDEMNSKDDLKDINI
jgi:hypothetical protein